MYTGGGFGDVKLATMASFPIEPAEQGSWSGRHPVSANGTELPKATLSTLSASPPGGRTGAEGPQLKLIPSEPMLLTVPNLPSARGLGEPTACPFTDTGVSGASMPSTEDGRIPLLTT